MIEQDSLRVGGVSYFIMLAAILIAAVMMASCAPTGTRCLTAWGIWAAPMGQPLGIGYWSSAHGDNVKCSRPEGPTIP
jgi:hypothetical protein